MIRLLFALFGPTPAQARDMEREDARTYGAMALLPFAAAVLIFVAVCEVVPLWLAAVLGVGAPLAAMLLGTGLRRVMLGIGVTPVLCRRAGLSVSYTLYFLMVMGALVVGRATGTMTPLPPPAPTQPSR